MVIAVIGVLAALVISATSGITSSTSEGVAEKNLEDLNSAVLNFNQANWELVLPQDPNYASASNALEIFQSLQYRSSVSAAPGSPYINPMYSFVESANVTSYRAVWNGRMFQMITPGLSGDGLDLLQMTQLSGTTVFGTNIPVGAP